MRYLMPTYVYTPEGLRSDLTVAIDEQGFIAAITPTVSHAASEGEVLPNMALLPGFVNVHSHVFQRALRGHTHRPLSRQDTFWTWRRAMYAEAQRLTPEILYEMALHTYREMLAAGYTTVGEFHYVHHQANGQPYRAPNAMAAALLAAAQDVGIRVVLLMAAYAQSGFAQPPSVEQKRFCDASVDAYLERVDALRTTGVAVGLAPHSVRAVPELWFRRIAEYSREHQLPLHVHADEQVSEIEQCLTAYGCRPIELLARFDALCHLTTVVHATHAEMNEISLLARGQSRVCVCPTTEGDLGDGIAPYADLLAAAIPLTIGSDSNTRLDPVEELRWAEYSARMRYQRRRVLVADETAAPGPLLLSYGTQQGAQALGLPTTGQIAVGMRADFVALDLTHAALRGWTAQDLLDVLFFGASAQVIVQTWVQGKRVWER